MSKPENFILNTDFATSKKDDYKVFTLTYTGSSTIPAGFTRIDSDIVMGSPGSIINSRIASSKYSNQFFATPVISFNRSGKFGTQSVPYNILAYVSRLSLDTVRATILIPNPYNTPFTSEVGDETFTFEVATIIPPIS